MGRLDEITIEALESVLNEVETKRETKRLMVAILYKRGPSVPMIAEWYNMREDTIYRWFDRLEERPIRDAITDDRRSGRPPKMDDSAFERFESAVNESPKESGYEHPAWSTQLAQRLLSDEFDVDYSQRHVQRLVKKAGLSHRPQQSRSSRGEEDDQQQVWKPDRDSH